LERTEIIFRVTREKQQVDSSSHSFSVSNPLRDDNHDAQSLRSVGESFM
jgi:hypothetical protein